MQPGKKQRIKFRHLDTFQRSVELILHYKLLRSFKCWIKYSQLKKEFRAKVKLNFKRRVFGAIKQRYVQKCRILIMEFQRQEQLMRECFLALAFQTDRQVKLRDNHALLRDKHIRSKTHAMFRDWFALFKYFSMFTQSTYCHT